MGMQKVEHPCLKATAVDDDPLPYSCRRRFKPGFDSYASFRLSNYKSNKQLQANAEAVFCIVTMLTSKRVVLNLVVGFGFFVSRFY